MEAFLYTTASIFSGGGFGDLGFKRAGFTTLLMCEKEQKRADFIRRNFEGAQVMCADVSTSCDEIFSLTQKELSLREQKSLFLLYATPPCQGISKNGIGTILKAIQDGKRPPIDQRNELYKPFLELVEQLRPRWIFFENVCRLFQFMGVDRFGNPDSLKNIIESEIRDIGYAGSIELVQMADYGIPQSRLRSVGIFRRFDGEHADLDVSFMPQKTHSEQDWLTLREVIADLEHLDAGNDATRFSNQDKLHFVPKWRPDLYRWMSATPEGETALNNSECDVCRAKENYNTVYCYECGAVLPVPHKIKDNKHIKIKGFSSSYRRLNWDRVAPTVTTRSAYACSDYNVHPTQNRVLSLLEIAKIQGIPHEQVCWQTDDGDLLPATLLRDLIGECVPTAFTELVGKHIIKVEKHLSNVGETSLSDVALYHRPQLELAL